MREVAEAMDPAGAVDEPGLDEMDVILLRPGQCFLERECRGIECIRVKTDLHVFLLACRLLRADGLQSRHPGAAAPM